MGDNPLDHLEAAKLATLIGSQLRVVDSQMADGPNMHSNRLDPRQFVRNVVNAANPNAAQQHHQNFNPNVSEEEARLLQMLNTQAMGQVPDISQGSAPALIPMPPQPTPQPQFVPQIQQAIPTSYVPQPIPAGDPIREIAEAVKSIDTSIKSLCDVFVIKAKKKKKRKVAAKSPKQSLPENPIQVIEETYIQPSTQQYPQNVENDSIT